MTFIKDITGNWIRRSSPRQEAGLRIFRVEKFLTSNGYALAQHAPVSVSTKRIMLDKGLLYSKVNLQDVVEERIRKSGEGATASDLHGLVFEISNIAPEYLYSDWSILKYKPGKIIVRYRPTDEESANLVKLTVKTPRPFFSSMSYNMYDYDGEKQLLLKWGDTSRLVVILESSDEKLGREILKVVRQ